MVAFKSCFLLLVDDVHGLCHEPRATHGSFDGNIVKREIGKRKQVKLIKLLENVNNGYLLTAIHSMEISGSKTDSQMMQKRSLYCTLSCSIWMRTARCSAAIGLNSLICFSAARSHSLIVCITKLSSSPSSSSPPPYIYSTPFTS